MGFPLSAQSAPRYNAAAVFSFIDTFGAAAVMDIARAASGQGAESKKLWTFRFLLSAILLHHRDFHQQKLGIGFGGDRKFISVPNTVAVAGV